MRFLQCLAVLLMSISGPVASYAKDFNGMDVSGKNFSKDNLDESNFEDAICRGSSFENCSLIKCNFQNADLENANFAYANLTGADFRNADMRGITVHHAVLDKANLEGADLSRVRFPHTSLREANLRNLKAMGHISETDFYKADLRGADLSLMTDDNYKSNFRKAIYDKKTRWPKWLDVEASGAVLTEDSK